MPGKSLEAKHIGRLGSLPQFHLGSNLDNECSIVYYNIVDMQKLTPNIQEVMTFPNWLSVQQNLRKLLSLKSVLYSPIWTIETNASLASIFFQICTLVDHAIRNNLSFESVD
jgi:hypothetical protein